eukprot:snap_masked-scaffold_43-processed-gene-1.86-mRNA-1 protein AED:0.00 eAED:0.00 QI:0/-1/0/1/-1/1/1/0/503
MRPQDKYDKIGAGAEDLEPKLSPSANYYALTSCIFASIGGIYFGYDQGVVGGMISMNSFKEDWCKEKDGFNCTDSANNFPPAFSNFVTLYMVIYNLGCVFGGLLGGLIAGKYGRKISIFLAALLFNFGSFWIISVQPFKYEVIILGRLIQGLGVGCSSFASPLYAAEIAPKEYRGAMTGLSQVFIVVGQVSATIINNIVKNKENGWRLTNSVIIIPPLIVMLFFWFLPESPRFIYQKKGETSAKELLEYIRKSDVSVELEGIKEQAEFEREKVSYLDCFEKNVRRRTFVAIFLQVLQQATGINCVFTFGGIIFASINKNAFLSLILLSGANCLSTFPSIFWLDSFGRRTLLLFGASGMFFCHLLIAASYDIFCEVEDSTCSKSSGELILFLTCLFVFFFAISWGPVAWVYPSEIFPLKVRARCVSLSTAANWVMGAVMMSSNQLFPILGISGIFYTFAAFCIVCFYFAYVFCPETRGLLLEEIDDLFEKDINRLEEKEELNTR